MEDCVHRVHVAGPYGSVNRTFRQLARLERSASTFWKLLGAYERLGFRFFAVCTGVQVNNFVALPKVHLASFVLQLIMHNRRTICKDMPNGYPITQRF